MASNYGRKPATGASGGPARRRSAGAAPAGRHPAPGVKSVRIGDLQDGRAARMRSRYNRYVRRVVMVLVALVALVALYAVLYIGGAFPVTRVTVAGAEHLTNEEVARVAAVPADSTLLRVDTAGIVARLESEAWVEAAGVTKVPPDTLRLDIRERSIRAVVQVPSKDGAAIEDWAIAGDGMWLMKIPARGGQDADAVSDAVYADAQQALHITDVPYGVEPEAGTYCSDASVTNALDIISGLSAELASQVRTVSAQGAETATITLQNGVQIAFGDADDVRDKERVTLQLLAQHEGQIAYINVRTPNRPTYRSL